MANMMHPLTGSDYVAEQAFAAAVTKAKTEMTAGLAAAAAAAVEATLDATINTKVAAATDTKVAAAIAALSLPAVTVADTAPTAPVDGHIWVDTTGATEILNVYSGTEWLVVTTTPAT